MRIQIGTILHLIQYGNEWPDGRIRIDGRFGTQESFHRFKIAKIGKHQCKNKTRFVYKQKI